MPIRIQYYTLNTHTCLGHLPFLQALSSRILHSLLLSIIEPKIVQPVPLSNGLVLWGKFLCEDQIWE